MNRLLEKRILFIYSIGAIIIGLIFISAPFLFYQLPLDRYFSNSISSYFLIFVFEVPLITMISLSIAFAIQVTSDIRKRTIFIIFTLLSVLYELFAFVPLCLGIMFIFNHVLVFQLFLAIFALLLFWSIGGLISGLIFNRRKNNLQ